MSSLLVALGIGYAYFAVVVGHRLWHRVRPRTAQECAVCVVTIVLWGPVMLAMKVLERREGRR